MVAVLKRARAERVDSDGCKIFSTHTEWNSYQTVPEKGGSGTEGG